MLTLSVACNAVAQPARCAHCGMRVDAASAFASGATDGGSTLAFDSVKCLLRYRLDHASVSAAWVTDYYERTHVQLEQGFFVLGSDLSGPMGPDFVAFGARASAERFVHDHHGRVLAFAEIDRAAILQLFGGR